MVFIVIFIYIEFLFSFLVILTYLSRTFFFFISQCFFFQSSKPTQPLNYSPSNYTHNQHRHQPSLGKTMDFLQEDMDSMLKELNVWNEETKNNKALQQNEERSAVFSVVISKSHLLRYRSNMIKYNCHSQMLFI